jgi:hypothetical protein
MTRAPILAALVLAACGDAAPPGFSTGPTDHERGGVDERQLVHWRHVVHRPADDSAGSSGSSSTGIVRDVGTAMDFGPVQPPGCKGKVDLLFVISRQGTMVTEQTQLLASFPGFIDTIEQKLEGFDVHILTANPDGLVARPCTCEKATVRCPDVLARPAARTPRTTMCETYPGLKTPCDEQLGAGLIFNAGAYAANKLCDLHGGHRYIVGDEPDMLARSSASPRSACPVAPRSWATR